MSRTNTTHLNTFNLPAAGQADLTFSSQPSRIVITVPKGSQFRMPLHWHPSSSLGCISVKCLSGELRVFEANDKTSGDRLGGPGTGINFKPGQLAAWSSAMPSRKQQWACVGDWSVESVVADQNLYRNTCSAILDRDIYPQLSRTPLWVKAVFQMLRLALQLREALLSYLLWVQLQNILYAHDFHEYHGRINLTWPWTAQPFGGRPPKWARDLKLQTYYLISRVVMASCYWLGRFSLGMKGQYPEYTPSRRRIDEEKLTLLPKA